MFETLLKRSLALAAVLALTAPAAAQDDERVPPNVAKGDEFVAPLSTEASPTRHRSFTAWLDDRGPIPGVDDGGFLVRELLGKELHGHSGATLGPIINVALDKDAVARDVLIRLAGDDTVRAVPVASLRVSQDVRFFTAMTQAQVEALPRPGLDDEG